MPDAFRLPITSSLFLRERGTGELTRPLMAEAVSGTVMWGEAGVVVGCCCGCAVPLGSRLAPPLAVPRTEPLRLLFFFFGLAAFSLPSPELCTGGSDACSGHWPTLLCPLDMVQVRVALKAAHGMGNIPRRPVKNTPMIDMEHRFSGILDPRFRKIPAAAVWDLSLIHI